ncbi:MAG: DUF2807 domain-containing protein [Gammaproteobacteria bacterium]|nr:DUF2807 domain-containing protein [Gammaproteobacteria bacterium]
MKTRSKVLLWFIFTVLATTFTSVSCFADEFNDGFSNSIVSGNGNIVNHAYPVSKQSFNIIKVDLGNAGDIKVNVTNKPHTASVIATADSSLLPYINVYIKNNALYIVRKDNVSFPHSDKIKVAINAEDLKAIYINGAGKAVIKGKEKTKYLTIGLHGSSLVNARNLVAKEVKVIIYGSGIITIHATQKINAEITGSGIIQYFGHPTQIEQKINGSGKVYSLE